MYKALSAIVNTRRKRKEKEGEKQTEMEKKEGRKKGCKRDEGKEGKILKAS